MNLQLKARLTLLYVTLFAIIVAAWSISVLVLVRADLYAGIDRALASRASQIALGISESDDGEFRDITESTLSGVLPTEAMAQLLSTSGAVLESSGDTMSVDPIVSPSTLRAAGRTGSAQTTTVGNRAGVRFRVLVIKVPGTDRFILVGTSTESADASVQRLALLMLVTGPLALLAAGGGGWLLARGALRPVGQMSSTAARIGIDGLYERVPVPPGSDELASLAVTLNSMLSRLEAGVEQKRRLVADASHELQTPLAVMRTELDVRLASTDLPADAIEALESVREEADRMTRIVRNLLTLARFDEGTLRLLRVPTELRALAEDAAASLLTLAREHDVSIAIAGTDTTARVDPEYFRLVLDNLLENAVRYSGDGSSVALETGTDQHGVFVTVRDDGRGIPAEALSRIFDRFYRVDSSRAQENEGSGLGLAISREIVQAHGGWLDAESSMGLGSLFTVRLPFPK